MDLIYETMDYGYDLTTPEQGSITEFRLPTTELPPSSTVNPDYLPPVGRQTTPSCFVWSSTYGAATFAAAQAGGYQPSGASDQASPGYTYVQVQKLLSLTNQCTGGHIYDCLDFLPSNGGTPTMQAAPTPDGCANVWSDYGKSAIAADPRFTISSWQRVSIQDTGGLATVRAVISWGTPLIYGTSLYTDFGSYGGTPTVYLGNGEIAYIKGTNTPVGHCMMIIGYDDNLGAVLLQNSFGTEWGAQWNGSGGFVWVDYNTFQALAQGTAFYIVGMSGGDREAE